MRRPRQLGYGLVAVGIVLAGGYWLLRVTHTGKFGAPTDIGGGLLALAGYGLVLAGAVVLAYSFVSRGRDRP